MATFTQRASGYWQARIRRSGYPVQSATFRTKAKAEAWARDVENQMERGVFEDRREAETTTLKTALERYREEVTVQKKSVRAEENLIKHWIARMEFSDKPLAALRSSDFAKFRDQRLKQVSSQTVRHELKLISHLYNIANREWGISVTNPLLNLRMPPQGKARERRLTGEEESYLMKALENSGAIDQQGKSRYNPWIAPIVRFALATAMRQGEILSLAWKSVDKAKRLATLNETKNGERRVVPLPTSALAVLEELPSSINGKVFPTTTEALRQSWTRAVARGRRLYVADCEASGKEISIGFLEELTFHDLRHEAISRFFELGLDAMTVAEISGHKTLQMLKRYTHLSKQDVAYRIAELEARRHEAENRPKRPSLDATAMAALHKFPDTLSPD